MIDVLKLPFLLYVENEKLPKISCVYFVVNNKHEIIYIGRTKNLKLRWRNHHIEKYLMRYKALIKIFYLEMSEELLEEFETKLIFYFTPRLNKRVTYPGFYSE
jgi:excinuclease UvrABC nuclease subunit